MNVIDERRQYQYPISRAWDYAHKKRKSSNHLSQVTLNATMMIPSTAAYGNYEGYVYFIGVDDDSQNYQMPFSATFSKEGIVSLDYPSMSDGFAKGLTAFNASAQLNKHANTFFTGVDIAFSITVSEPINTITTYVKDKVGNVIGSGGSQEATWISEGSESLITDMVPGGRVYRVVEGQVYHEQIPLAEGIYDLEVVAKTLTGKEFRDSLPIAIINDTNSDTVTFNLNGLNLSEGIIEVSDELYSGEYWYDGLEHEAIWLRANVYNDYVNQLKTTEGLDYLQQSHLNSIFAYANYPNGYKSQIGTMAEEGGDVLVAGIEKEDF